MSADLATVPYMSVVPPLLTNSFNSNVALDYDIDSTIEKNDIIYEGKYNDVEDFSNSSIINNDNNTNSIDYFFIIICAIFLAFSLFFIFKKKIKKFPTK